MLHPTTVVVVAINPCMRAGTTRRIYILDMCAADCLSYILPGFLFVFVLFLSPSRYISWAGKENWPNPRPFVAVDECQSGWGRRRRRKREGGGLHLSLLDIVPHSAIWTLGRRRRRTRRRPLSLTQSRQAPIFLFSSPVFLFFSYFFHPPIVFASRLWRMGLSLSHTHSAREREMHVREFVLPRLLSLFLFFFKFLCHLTWASKKKKRNKNVIFFFFFLSFLSFNFGVCVCDAVVCHLRTAFKCDYDYVTYGWPFEDGPFWY